MHGSYCRDMANQSDRRMPWLPGKIRRANLFGRRRMQFDGMLAVPCIELLSLEDLEVAQSSYLIGFLRGG
jgi:hypothetical protein